MPRWKEGLCSRRKAGRLPCSKWCLNAPRTRCARDLQQETTDPPDTTEQESPVFQPATNEQKLLKHTTASLTEPQTPASLDSFDNSDPATAVPLNYDFIVSFVCFTFDWCSTGRCFCSEGAKRRFRYADMQVCTSATDHQFPRRLRPEMKTAAKDSGTCST